MEEAFLKLETLLVWVNGLIERIVRSFLELFVTAKSERGTVKSKLIRQETKLYKRLFDREFLGDELFTVPNLFSFSRIPFGLILIPMVRYEMPQWVIVTTLGVAILTDRLDGVWARIKGETNLGAFVDPACDKVLFTACMIAYFYHIPQPLFWTLVGTELFLFLFSFAVFAGIVKGAVSSDVDIRSNMFGKTKFFFECIALVLLIFGSDPSAALMLITAFIFAVLSAWRKIWQVSKKTKSPD